MLEINQLTCIRDDRVLFSPLTFSVESGDLIQIVGANGAGKSTLLNVLTGLSTPDEGHILWYGQSYASVREHWHKTLLWIGHRTGMKEALTAHENLRFYHPDSSIVTRENALAEVGLAGYEDIPLNQLSAGQQRRVALARLWLSTATLFILDEPFTALDKSGVQLLTDRLQQFARQGGCAIFTTHQALGEMNYPLRTVYLKSASNALF